MFINCSRTERNSTAFIHGEIVVYVCVSALVSLYFLDVKWRATSACARMSEVWLLQTAGPMDHAFHPETASQPALEHGSDLYQPGAAKTFSSLAYFQYWLRERLPSHRGSRFCDC